MWFLTLGGAVFLRRFIPYSNCHDACRGCEQLANAATDSGVRACECEPICEYGSAHTCGNAAPSGWTRENRTLPQEAWSAECDSGRTAKCADRCPSAYTKDGLGRVPE
jgi:hypothetical protein